jgi:hypothetical protein
MKLVFNPTTGKFDWVNDNKDFVPYTGAVSNVNLGTHNFTVDTNTLFVDSVNHRLGIGTTAPGYKLDIDGGNIGAVETSVLHLRVYDSQNRDFYITNTGSGAGGNWKMGSSANSRYILKGYTVDLSPYTTGEGGSYEVRAYGNLSVNTNQLYVQQSTGNVGIGTTGPGYLLDVNGHARVNNNLFMGSSSIPIGLNYEVGGTTPLLNFDVNFHQSGYSTTYLGSAYRIDARYPSATLHGWFYRAAGSANEYEIMSLNPGTLGIKTSTGTQQILLNTGGNSYLNGGNVGIGTTSPNAAAILHLNSTTKGFLPPQMTTTQRGAISSPPEGLLIWNTTTKALNVYDGTSWREINMT